MKKKIALLMALVMLSGTSMSCGHNDRDRRREEREQEEDESRTAAEICYRLIFSFAIVIDETENIGPPGISITCQLKIIVMFGKYVVETIVHENLRQIV